MIDAMKKYFVLGLLSFSVAVLVPSFAQIPADYYSAAQGKKGEALRTALNTCIAAHEVLNYDALEEYYVPTDFRPDSTLWDMYSTCEYYRRDAGGTQDDFCQHWNKEHTVCQSWFGSGDMGSDLFQVLPTDARVNNLRANYPYGETASRNDKISQGAPYALGHLGTSSFSGYTTVGTVYEPDDRYKGDIARIYFYMATCYLNSALDGSYGSKMFTYSGGKTGLTDYSVALLMKWHRQDPVSYKEIARNDSVYKQQYNRNPFVDFPELAEYVWGNKTNTSLDLATALTAYSGYVPLDTEGSDRTDYDKFGVTWSVNGADIQTDSVFKNHKPTDMPSTPVSCSPTSSTFVGWTTSPLSTTSDTPPTDLFTDPLEAPSVDSDMTFYAVFAHKEQGQGMGSVTETASFTTNDGYKRGNVISSAQAGKVTITFAKGTNSNAPKFFTELRCYGGNTITLTGATISAVEFVPGPTDGGNAIKANTGTMNGLKWTGSANTIVFTIDGESGNRGLSAIKVTYDDNTTVFVYSDYLTQCGTQDVEAVNGERLTEKGEKLIINGQLYLKYQGAIYNVQGVKIQ